MQTKHYILVFTSSLLMSFSLIADFADYQVILDRKPFGEAPAEPIPEEKPIPLSQSFAKNLRMSALLEMDDGTLKVGLVDQQTKMNFYVAVGQTVEGIELVSASYEEEEAVIRKGSEMAVIKLSSGDIQPLTATEQKERLDRRKSYVERRKARAEQRAKMAEKIEPKYTGEELEKHLQEYQMEVIRQGLPPLPIPLTDEMDQQLVDEGVLPPM